MLHASSTLLILPADAGVDRKYMERTEAEKLKKAAGRIVPAPAGVNRNLLKRGCKPRIRCPRACGG